MALLVDIGGLDACCTDHALEAMHKALADEDGLAHNIWAEHESPFIRSLVERFSERGLLRLAEVRDHLWRWLAGDYHVPGRAVPAAQLPGMMSRWAQPELDLVRTYLEAISPDALTLADWELVVEYTVQRYMPLDALYEDAEWLAVKSHLMGKVQAHMGVADAAIPASLIEALPATVADAGVMFRIADVKNSVLAYGRSRACDAVQAVAESARHQLRRAVLDYQSRRLSGDPTANVAALQQKLFDSFDALNRDWRRIAVTEAGEMANQGVVLSMPEGARLRRMEQYNGACPFCKKLDGRIFKVVSGSAPNKNGETEVWPGKTNVGRSASPRKRVGNELIDRLPSERWWAAAGTQHPHCRGRWEPMQAAQPGDDPAFAEWLRARLGQKEGMA